MLSPLVMAGGCFGRIFEGTVAETFCFVPEKCILSSIDRVEISEIEYVHSGWDVRNMRFSDVLSGQHLFPDATRPVVDFSGARVRVFLSRIGTVHLEPEFQRVDSSS